MTDNYYADVLNTAVKHLDKLEQAIARIRELHTKAITLCNNCYQYYPCQTIEALDGEQ